MIAGKALRYKSILASVLSLRGQGIFLEHLPKSDMFDSFSSPLHQVLHTPSFWCWSQSPGERKKSRGWLLCFVRNRSFLRELSETRQRERELEHFIIQQYLGVWVYVCGFMCICVCVCARNRETERDFQRLSNRYYKMFLLPENRQEAGMILRFNCWGCRVWSS